MNIQTQSIPAESKIQAFASDADFADCYVAPNPWPELSALQLFMKTVGNTPGWVNLLMRLRNRIVALLGLKNLGVLNEFKPTHAYQIGERVGIFTLLYNSESEVILGDLDKHLEVRLSVLKTQNSHGSSQLSISTAVHEHNALGKIYMLFVGPIHKIIVPAVLRRGLKT
ncbi:DUF2867 domain-containing protein [Variovorax sp. PCZ-1]|uniref:DUF2867 domain-containing protein n=1 Tax=Variovorax sp. PCZ-1 TaxID=2835533 RepID=UPI001BCE82D5|nr:DUF2867 domain-containing protein [Variovorax sp. PCZ-1]MBS7807761.1 DUF2867 domain-containing protein [Variovorax sp. PCZ-1]